MAKAHTLVDNFNDDTTDTALWTVAGTVATETNGRVQIRPPGNQAGYYTYASSVTYDLTESQMRVEIVTASTSPGVATGLAASITGNDYILIWVKDGYVESMQGVGGVSSILRRVPYDPAAHRWLRLSEWTGTTFWEVSADGSTWTVLHQAPDPIPLTSVLLEFGVRVTTVVTAPGFAAFDNFNVQNTSLSRRVEERRLSARDVRVQAAQVAAERRHDEHVNNNDETNYPTWTGRELAGMYSKSLRHDDFGDPEPVSYASLLRALESRDPHDFEEIILGPAGAPVKLTNPQSGLAFDIEGPDAQERTLPPAPRFDSEVAAHEMGELYWMAALRDVPFLDYDTDSLAAGAVASLNTELPRFGGTVPVTDDNLFRGIYPGEQVGPYVSQFLLKGNVDPRKPGGQGLNATDGFISYGSRNIDQRLFSATPGVDYLTDFPTWLDVQNGQDTRGTGTFESTKRFIYNLRAGATFVHFDQVLDAFYNAAWILMSEPEGNQLTNAGRTGIPQVRVEFPKNDGNPYDPPGTALDSRTQAGFNTFGPTHLLQALAEVMGRALRAVWWQKWGVHRRLRPEEYGGRVHNQVLYNTSGFTEGRTYPLHVSLIDSIQNGELLQLFSPGGPFTDSWLLPQAYPEGAPTHPAYGAGHATGSGALVTILKAFFSEDTPIENPVQASADGLSLVAYAGADAGQMTVGGELNKLAGNISLFRNAAGVHWRSDYTESLPFGESIAIGLLQEMSLGFNEDDAFFELTRFDGQKIRIFDGKVVPVVV
ncbi:MAG TPA: vanadium-dependent haloperoxidase [Longimicrobium sp.]|uniref:vanadium-dependent haloperoxidase n=1 Tax=Longimicrobium sp. TaxID=2029185 RepID=UPI002ED931CA